MRIERNLSTKLFMILKDIINFYTLLVTKHLKINFFFFVVFLSGMNHILITFIYKSFVIKFVLHF